MDASQYDVLTNTRITLYVCALTAFTYLLRYNVICSDTLHLKILCRFISVCYGSGRREQGQTEIETKGKSKGES